MSEKLTCIDFWQIKHLTWETADPTLEMFLMAIFLKGRQGGHYYHRNVLHFKGVDFGRNNISNLLTLYRLCFTPRLI